MGGVGGVGVLLFVAAAAAEEGTCIHEGRLGWAAFFTSHFQNPQTFFTFIPQLENPQVAIPFGVNVVQEGSLPPRIHVAIFGGEVQGAFTLYLI